MEVYFDGGFFPEGTKILLRYEKKERFYNEALVRHPGGRAGKGAALGAGPAAGGQNPEPQHGPVQLPPRLPHHPHDRQPRVHSVTLSKSASALMNIGGWGGALQHKLLFTNKRLVY